MPIAKVRTNAEKYIPPELLVVRTVLPGDKFLLTDTVARTPRLTPEEKRELRHKAAQVTQHVRQLLGLSRREFLEHIWPVNYHEFDESGEEIATAGEHVYRPVVRGEDGNVRQEQTVWIDEQRRHPRHLTEGDITFTGRIALESDRLGGGWVINRGHNPNNVPHLTPRDNMLADELEQSKVREFPIPSADQVPAPPLGEPKPEAA